MAVNMRVHKVTALPGTLEASALYFVTGSEANLLDIYVSSNDGLSARNVITKTEINNMIVNAVAAGSNGSLSVVADITALNALTPTEVTLVLVLDATGDATVATGAATYVYDATAVTPSWIKIAEHESLDLVLSWANITGKPTSAAAAIDDAVAAMHAHTNLSTLDKFGEDGNGDLMFDGVNMHAYLSSDQW